MYKQKPATEKIACFVSIPKCASKSILEILELGENRDEDSVEKTERFVIYENHQRLSVLEQKYDLTGKYVFAFVRNPYERLSSWYQYHRALEPYRSCTFEQWVLQGCPTHWVIQNATNWAIEGLTPLLQHNFISSEHMKMDFVGRMESFSIDMPKIVSDLNSICYRLGQVRRFEFKNIRVNCSRPYLNSYTPEMKEVVLQLFRKDFNAFGYET